MSNVGRVWARPDGTFTDHLGPAPIEEVQSMYQAGYPTPATVGVYTFRGQTQIEASYASGGLTADEADALLEGIRREMLDLIES